MEGIEADDSMHTGPKCEQFKALFDSVRKKLEMANNKASEVYNLLRRRCEEHIPGQLVWNFVLSDATKHFSSKLTPKYIGPFYIHKKISPWTCALRDAGGKVVARSSGGGDLKMGPDKSDGELTYLG